MTIGLVFSSLSILLNSAVGNFRDSLNVATVLSNNYNSVKTIADVSVVSSICPYLSWRVKQQWNFKFSFFLTVTKLAVAWPLQYEGYSYTWYTPDFIGFLSYIILLLFYKFLGSAVHKLQYWGSKPVTKHHKMKLDLFNQLFFTLIKLRFNLRTYLNGLTFL